MSDYKLLVLDVDGTLIGHGAYPSPRVAEAIAKAKQIESLGPLAEKVEAGLNRLAQTWLIGPVTTLSFCNHFPPTLASALLNSLVSMIYF